MFEPVRAGISPLATPLQYGIVKYHIALVSLLSLSGCGTSTPPPAAAVMAQAGSGSATSNWRDRATAFERGTYVHRDYRKADAIYLEVCALGKGVMDACLEALVAASTLRGLIGEEPIVKQCALSACEQKSDFACELLSVIDRDNPLLKRWHSDVRGRCANGSLDSCWALVMSEGINTGPEPDQVRTADERHECQAGLRDACVQLLLDAKKQPLVVDKDLQAWAEHARADAASLAIDCDLGDALACKSIPGKAVLPAVLCEAGDFDQCRLDDYAGKSGDIACDAGIGVACAAVAERIETSDPKRAKDLYARACKLAPELADAEICKHPTTAPHPPK